MEEIQDNIVKYLKKPVVPPKKTAFVFIDVCEVEIFYGELRSRIETLSSRLQFYSLNDKKALLIYTLEFISSFFSCQCLGTVTLPITTLKKNNITGKLLNLTKDSELSVLCSNNLLTIVKHPLHLNNPEHLASIATDLNYPEIKNSRFQNVLNSRIFFIQNTSCFTTDPKAAVMMHKNLISNQHQIKQVFNCNQKPIILSWLQFHRAIGLPNRLYKNFETKIGVKKLFSSLALKDKPLLII